MGPAGDLDYPVELGLAYLLLVGYGARVACGAVHLPGSVGVFLAGFAYSYFMESELLSARNQLQELAFFFVLLNAGFEIRLKEVRLYVLVMASLPAAFELLGLTLYGVCAQGYTLVESLVLGTVLFCLGEGLVVPKMEELSSQFPGHPMPRLVLTWASLEATFALTLFGILTGVSDPANHPHANVGVLILGSAVQVTCTVAAGATFGASSGWLIARRGQLKYKGKQVFMDTTVEAFLLILGVALVVYSLGDPDILSLGLVEGDSLFQPELFVIVTGCFFAHSTDPVLLQDVGSAVSGVWVFGSIILFTLLGSRTDIADFEMKTILQVVPLMTTGMFLRFVGVLVATWLTAGMRGGCRCARCVQAHKASFVPDALFCFLSSLPRATIQGALGSLPVQQRFFQYDPSRREVQAFVAATARLYIFVFSILGAVLLEFHGPNLLRVASQRRALFACERAADAAELDGRGLPADPREVTLAVRPPPPLCAAGAGAAEDSCGGQASSCSALGGARGGAAAGAPEEPEG
ncbi:unnamed protein product, partial [Prorocentrum cordatum]